MPKCIVEITDEVNVRFRDLDPGTRRKMITELEYMIENARYTPAVKLGRWDGKKSFCDVGGRTYLNLLDRVLPIVQMAGYEIEVDDKRHEWPGLEFKYVNSESYAHQVWPAKHPIAGQPIILRDYQVEIINCFLDNLQCLQQIATGAGKTLITAVLSDITGQYGRTVVIVPNKDLVVQTEKDYINMGMDVGVLYGDRKEYNKQHTICTWQSLDVLEKNTKIYSRRDTLSQSEKELILESGDCWCCDVQLTKQHKTGCLYAEGNLHDFLKDVVCVMVDEVHKAKATVLQKQLSGMFANVPIRWGLTGTIPKEDYDSIGCTCALGPVVGKLSSKELQDRGVLSKLDIDVLQLQDGMLGFTGYQQELKWLTTDRTRLLHISEIINELAKDGNTLVLVDRIATGDMLIEMNPDWVFVTGGTKQAARQKEYDDVADMDGKVIVATYGVAAVGINIPRIFNLVMVEAGKSFVRVIQTIGRGIRKAHDKDYVRVVDITSSLKYSKRHLTKRKAYYREQEFPFKVTKVTYK